MEVRATDLRIGNLVNVDGVDIPQHVAAITALNASFCNVEIIGEGEPYLSHNHEKDYPQIEPIPLTEDWLLKFGFEINLTRTAFWDDQEFLLGIEGDRLFYGEWAEHNEVPYVDKKIEVKFVHQLQNLYYALTASELTVKEEVNQ